MDPYYDFIILLSTVGSDALIEGIIKNNVLLGGFIFLALKVAAVLTPSTTDDKILTMLRGNKGDTAT